jgi:beta-glucosidase
MGVSRAAGMSLPVKSRLDELVAPEAFSWATGIEDTFITAPHPTTGRTLDEYELTGHYEQWHDDLGRVAELGVSAARYGIPWHRIQPEPDRWDWEFADKTLNRLLDLGVAPQVDLVHYGLPPWIHRGYLNPDYPRLVADYASRLAERFHGRIHWYTPLNEPRITAWYCGRLGWWPPHERSVRGFVALMLAICRGIVATVKALERVDPEIVAYHVDATDVFSAAEPDLAVVAEVRQHLVFLALDLLTGRVDRHHPLWRWLLAMGATEAELESFQSTALELSVIGLNLYPMFTQKTVTRDAKGRMRVRMPYAGGDLVGRLARMYYERYRAPMIISETASFGSIARRLSWMRDSLASVRQVRSEGVPVVGYTWWPMFALVTWAYRQGHRPVADHILQMGLWDLRPGASGQLERHRTGLIDAYAGKVARGSEVVGSLAPSKPTLSKAMMGS